MPNEKEPHTSEVSLLVPLAVLLRRWRSLVVFPLAVGFFAAAWTALTREYTAISSFAPEAPSGQQNQLLGLAAQFGISLNAGDQGISVDFYRKLLRSRDILSDLAVTRFDVARGDSMVAGTLVELLEIPDGRERDRLSSAISRLRGAVSVTVDRPAGVVEVRTTAPWEELAEAMNRRLLELVNTFNLEKRGSSAAARRDFARLRVKDAEAELGTAEEELRRFMEANRRFTDSPELVLEQRRLQRRVDLKQQVSTTLAQSYEQARVDAVRDIPLITIVEKPEGSVEPSAGIKRSVVLGVFFGLLVGMGIAFGTEYMALEKRKRPEAFAEFASTWNATLGRMSPLRLRRTSRSGRPDDTAGLGE